MKIAWIDCFAGISGDMILGALADCGLQIDYLTKEISKLGLTDFTINISPSVKNQITAKRIKIDFDTSKQPDRRYTTIKAMIKDSELSDGIKRKALKAFEILGKAEAKIHGIPLKNVHFHEVGAVDSIIDIVGAILGFEFLNIDKIYTSPVPMGTGFASTEHGMLPVPSPAAIEILKDYPIIHRQSGFEMTTPTGATLVQLLSDGPLPEDLIFNPTQIGYGAGSKDIEQWPNILRIVIGEIDTSEVQNNLFIIETNIDDLNPEIYPYIMERLFAAKAKDVYFTPIIMKKGRPGILISVLAVEQVISEIERILFAETSTIGIRRYRVKRIALIRESKKIKTRFGVIPVKISTHAGKKTIHPEYEECLKIARQMGVGIIDVYREIESMNLK